MAKNGKRKKPKTSHSADKKEPRAGGESKKFINPPEIEDSRKKPPSWSFRHADQEMWCVREHFCYEILSKLVDYEGMTWNEILNATGGKGSRGTKNHPIEINSLVKTARKRLEELNIVESSLVSLTVGSKGRLWGWIAEGTMNILWFDPEHEICPSKKKHT